MATDVGDLSLIRSVEDPAVPSSSDTLGTRPTLERCFLAMLAVERTCDAIADALGLSEAELLNGLTEQLNALA